MIDAEAFQGALLMAGVFAASSLQSASGIGFGVIAGPLIMIRMNSGAAVQVSILLSFVIALLLAPGALRGVDRALLRRLVIGTLAGAPAGVAAFVLLELRWLKLLAAAITLFNVLSMLGLIGWRSKASPARQQLWVGAVSGALSAAIAMPGPVVNAHLARTARSKQAVRSATLALFLWSYPVAYAAQALVASPSGAALDMTLRLLPACLLGVPAGVWLAQRISEPAFRRLGIAVMLATIVGLVLSA